jgi:hypothetical protein
MFYDVEGFSNSKIISISLQNRSKGFDGTAFYIKSGFHQAVLMGEFKTCDNYNHCAITAATIQMTLKLLF